MCRQNVWANYSDLTTRSLQTIISRVASQPKRLIPLRDNCYPISPIHLNPTYHPCPSNNIIPFPSADLRGLGWLGAGRRSRECSGWVVEHRAAGAQASFGALDRIAFVKSCLHWHPQGYRSGISIHNSWFLLVTLIYTSRFLMDIPTVGVSKNGVVPPCLAIFIGEITIKLKPWSTHGFWHIVHIFPEDFPSIFSNLDNLGHDRHGHFFSGAHLCYRAARHGPQLRPGGDGLLRRLPGAGELHCLGGLGGAEGASRAPPWDGGTNGEQVEMVVKS